MPHEGNEQIVHRDEPTGMLALIDRYVRDPSVDVEKFRALLTMKREMEAQEAETALIEALARIADKLKDVRIVKRREVSYDNKGVAFKYAALEDIDLILRPIIAEEGIVLTDTTIPREAGGGALVIVRATHRLGAFREASIPMPLDSTGGKSNAQAMGSTLMYGRRQGRCMLFNIVVVGDDDDGTGGTIDEAQAKAIRALLEQTGSNEAAFLKYLKAPSIEAIPYRAYPKAMSALEEKMAKNADHS
jgi:hypothetical protein